MLRRSLHIGLLGILLLMWGNLSAQESEHGVHQITFHFNEVPFQFSFVPTDSVWHEDISGGWFVTIQGYYAGVTEVTRRQYDAIMPHSWSWPDLGDNSEELPATGLTRTQWQEFLDTLNRRYITEFRIPTRHEWEECYHGGVLSMGYRYSGSNRLNWVGHTDGKLHPVGQLIPNELELWDMDGNAKEYVNDAPFDVEPLPEELPIYGLRMVANTVMNLAKKE